MNAQFQMSGKPIIFLGSFDQLKQHLGGRYLSEPGLGVASKLYDIGAFEGHGLLPELNLQKV